MKIYSEDNIGEAFNAGENFGGLPFSTDKNIPNKKEFLATLKPTELRVCVVNSIVSTSKSHLDWFDSSNDEFFAEAEINGGIYTLDEFENMFNNNDGINQNEDLIRFLKIPVN